MCMLCDVITCLHRFSDTCDVERGDLEFFHDEHNTYAYKYEGIDSKFMRQLCL